LKLTAGDLRRVPHREFRNSALLGRRPFTGVSTDSRKVKPGDVFVALRGERFDGHTFVAAAFAAGAAGAVVDGLFTYAWAAERPLLIVDNTLDALTVLARLFRDKFSLPVLAIGGSNGKTTTKDMVAAILRRRYTVLSTEGNLNNQIGVPVTLFRLERRHEAAVIEMGSNHPGEIAALCAAVHPTHGLLTNIGREHMEFFRSIEGVAREEGALFTALRQNPGGMIIENADDPHVAKMAKGMKKRLSYGFAASRCDIRGRNITIDRNGCASFEFRGPRMTRWLGVRLGVPGEHTAKNALAAAAAGLALKVPAQGIKNALESFQATGRRMEIVMVTEVMILNDTYNANPDSMLAALKTLASIKRPGKKIAVLADMKELGTTAPEAHALVGRNAAKLGLDYVLTYGPQAREIHSAAAFSGAIHYDQKNMLAEYLAELLTPGDTVLVKGSRAMAMEDVVEFLRERLQPVARR
jgi:UDP-N-acetylmuramoyl-tripeptide--D-alanyl-D-alanine ligase